MWFIRVANRIAKNKGGAWAFPGGFMNMDETTEQCAIQGVGRRNRASSVGCASDWGVFKG